MEREELIQKATESISTFLKLFNQYSDEITDEHKQEILDELRTKLQRIEQDVTGYLVDILGNDITVISSAVSTMQVEHRRLLPSALMGGNNELRHNFYGYKGPVTGLLNRALGAIEAGLWPPKAAKPVLVIHDSELETRCSDLLSAPGAYDRVIREATTVLEDRIRKKVTHKVLSGIIPNSADQIGENLVNKVFNPDSPVLSISSEKDKRVAFRKMLVGIFAYLRNPYHHRIDPATEWSWAWSSVGFIDELLDVIDNSTITQ